MKKLIYIFLIILFASTFYSIYTFNLERLEILDWVKSKRVELVEISPVIYIPNYTKTGDWKEFERCFNSDSFPNNWKGDRSRIIVYRTGDSSLHKAIIYFNNKNEMINGLYKQTEKEKRIP